ncbi:hypothetical protein [Dyella silvatica]|uniref:hypothetical protein n=1 Tax=Dyella silvatica TaxID=2992128 RepID=UPI002259DBC8|nr:hypothetical protein [Dyella silvatica]
MTSKSTFKRALVALTLLCGFALASTQATAAGAAKTVLLVVRKDGKSLAYDQKIEQHLSARGFAVTLYDQYQPAAKAKDFDLVVLSSTVRSRDLLDAYRNTPAPMVTWESDLLDDMAMSGKRPDTDFGKLTKQHGWSMRRIHWRPG